MNLVEISKALSNDTRVLILKWLKDPENNFPPHESVEGFDDGVCGKFIQDKAGLSQSTISHYLSMLQKASLIIATRHGKWTYFKRNEDTIKKFVKFIDKEL